MTRPRLSIVICTYNGAAYLKAQLDSLLAQTCLPDEIVVGDDGSTDATPDILHAFVEQAVHAGIAVKLRRNPVNLGYVGNFSAGLREATGDVLFLCDQDDVWRSDKLARMAACFADDPQLLLLHSDARLVDANGESQQCSLFDALQLTTQERWAIHAGRALEVAMRRSFVTGATAALRRDLVDLALPVAQDWIHDEWLTIIAVAVGRVDFIDAPLIDYRQHDGNQIGARRRTLAMKWHDLLQPRGCQLSDEVTRLRRLEEFLAQRRFQDNAALSEQIRHKRSHFERRIAIGHLPRWRRLLLVLHEATEGYYRHYGTGSRSVLRDLLRHD